MMRTHLFTSNFLWFNTFHDTNSIDDKSYSWWWTLQCSNLCIEEKKKMIVYAQFKLIILIINFLKKNKMILQTSTTSFLFNDFKLAKAASWRKEK